MAAVQRSVAPNGLFVCILARVSRSTKDSFGPVTSRRRVLRAFVGSHVMARPTVPAGDIPPTADTAARIDPDPTNSSDRRSELRGTAGATNEDLSGKPGSGPKLRVLHLLKGLGPGGAENLILASARSQERLTTMEVAYLLPWKNHLVDALASANVRTHCLRGARIYSPTWLLRLLRLIRNGDFDVIHLHSPVCGAIVRPFLRLLRRRPAVISTEHNSWASHAPWTRRLNQLTLRLGDGWIAVSDEVLASIPFKLRSRVRVLVHGIDTAAVAAHSTSRHVTRAALGVNDNDIMVITVANLRSQKAYEHLLEVAKAATTFNPHLRFFAVGQGPLEAELRAHHLALGLGDRFEFLGYRDDAHQLLAAADIYALASRFEGLPLAAMEALAAGLPIVTTAVGGMGSVVTENVNGHLVDTGDIDAMTARIVSLAEDSDRRAGFRAAALDRAAAFDVGRADAEILAVYKAAREHA